MTSSALFRALVLAASILPTAADEPGSASAIPKPQAPPPAPVVPAAGVSEVVIVYKTHFDIGYTARASRVIHDYRTEMADRLLHAIERNQSQPKDRQFVWTLSGFPMREMLWEGQDPQRRQAIEHAIRAGNIAIHAYPYSMHTEIAEPEDLVRGLNISSRLARRLDQPLSISAKMTDVPGQSWITPTLLTHAGVRFYQMGGPLVNKSFNLPPLFWWEGPDGSRLLTLYKNDYGTSALPPAGWPFKCWLNLSMTGDNQGPPPPETVARDLAFYQQKGIQAKVGTLDDFARLLLAENLDALPVVKSDIPDPWIHGTMSMPLGARFARHGRLRIGALEALTSLERAWGIHRPDLRTLVDRAYEQAGLYCEHTWGMANQHYVKLPWGQDWDRLWAEGLPPNFRAMEDSWNDHIDYARKACDLTDEPYREATATLADHVAVKGRRIVVYNPLPWVRDGEVVVNAFHFPSGTGLQPADGGPPVLCVAEGPGISTPDRIRRFVAREVPPLGYRTYTVTNETPPAPELVADSASSTIESPFFKAILNPQNGCISSLIDKRSGRELVDASAPHGFGSYLYERFSWQNVEDWLNASLYPQYRDHRFLFGAYDMPRDVPYSAAVARNLSLSVKRTAIDVSAVMTGTLENAGQPQRITIRLTLPAASPVADLQIDWQKQPDSWPEAGWICLPFKIAHPKFRLGKLGGDLDPVTDFKVENANYHHSWVQTGAAVYDAESGAGAGVCPLDSPLVSLGVPGEYKFSARYEPTVPSIYLNLYNNHWRTNFSAWVGDGRKMSSRVRIWSFDRFDSEAALFTPAMEARVPLAAAISAAREGPLPPSQAGITLSRKGVSLTAFGPNPDGAGTILRVWEQGGLAGDLTITLPPGFSGATPVTLRGEPLGKRLPLQDRRFTVPLGRYAPASFVLD
ncbi:MAG: hypothetical protein KA004_14500 [Verrucomicrobiales bacterium]|nr:hypothetical protein [Verrucomicrobiales bacterium]